MMTAYGYVRVSGLGQAGEGKDGFARQGEAIGRWCAANGYELSALFVERGVSGRKDETERPAFTDLITLMLGNCVRQVVVENLSRLAREYRIQEQLLVYLAMKKIDLLSADTGENITQAMLSDPMKKAVIQIQGVFFELERSLLVHKLKVAKDRLRASGQRCEGPKPFGELDGEGVVKEIILTKRLRLKSISEIAAELNAEGIRTRHGKHWHATSVGRVLRRGRRE